MNQQNNQRSGQQIRQQNGGQQQPVQQVNSSQVLTQPQQLQSKQQPQQQTQQIQQPQKIVQPINPIIDLEALKTKSGKTIHDFEVSDKLKATDKPLIDLIMRSESMNDDEKQYWFNLTVVMNTEQIEKLRDILVRERKKLAEIEAKYAKPKVDPIEAAKRAKELATKRAAEQKALAAKEAAYLEQQNQQLSEDDILAELEGL